MKNKIRATLSGLVIAGTALLGTSAANAQIPDVPPLGFEIDPSEGSVGSTVNGQVNPADISQHCETDPGVWGTSTSQILYGAFTEWAASKGLDLESGEGVDPNDPLYMPMFLVFMGATGLATQPDIQQSGIESTFVMAFADIESASPIDPLGSFDRNTGEGSVVVPNISGGMHPVIATCVSIKENISISEFDTAFNKMAAYYDSKYPEPTSDFTELQARAADIVPVLLRELVEPKALGFQFYCVDDGEGSCDEPVETTTTTTAVTPTTTPRGTQPPGGSMPPGGSSPGKGGLGGSGYGATPAIAVRGSANYTG